MSIENNPVSAIGNSLKSSWLQRVLFVICKQIAEDEETKVNGQFFLCADDVCKVYNDSLITEKFHTKFLENSLYELQKYSLVFTMDDGVKIASPLLSKISRKDEVFTIDFDMGMRRFFVEYFLDNNELNSIEYSSLRGKFSRKIYKLIMRKFSERIEISFPCLKDMFNFGTTHHVFRSDFTRRLLWAKKEIEKKTPLRFSWEFLTTQDNQKRIVFTEIQYAESSEMSDGVTSDIETHVDPDTEHSTVSDVTPVASKNQKGCDISSSRNGTVQVEILPPGSEDYEDAVIEENECPDFIKNGVQFDVEQRKLVDEQEDDEDEEIDAIKFLRNFTATRESDPERYNELFNKYMAHANKRIIGIGDVCNVKPSLAYLEFYDRSQYDKRDENFILMNKQLQCKVEDHFHDLMSDCYGRCNKPEICKLCRDTKPTREQAIDELKRRYLNHYAIALLWQPEDVAEFMALGGEMTREMHDNMSKMGPYNKSIIENLKKSAQNQNQEQRVA